MLLFSVSVSDGLLVQFASRPQFSVLKAGRLSAINSTGEEFWAFSVVHVLKINSHMNGHPSAIAAMDNTSSLSTSA